MTRPATQRARPAAAPASAAPAADALEPLPPLGPLPRLAATTLAWAAIFCASPGVLSADGSAALAAAALVPWALAASRPGRRAFLAEWLAAALGLGALMWWAVYVWPPGVAYIGLGAGLYMAGAGALLRRLARRLPLVVAAPLAWVGVETLRYVVPTPFGLGWMRLGHSLHHVLALSGSARVWGVGGLSLVLAAVAAGVAELVRTRRVRWAALGLAPGLLALVLALAFPAPASVPGPRLLLVQPAVPQERKGDPGDPRELFSEACELTARGLARAAQRGDVPDLVCWGETMLPLSLVSPALVEALRAGEQLSTWTGEVIDSELVARLARAEDLWIRRDLFGQRVPGTLAFDGFLPDGIGFLSGAEVLDVVDGVVRRRNAIALWDSAGERGPLVGKTRLVPGGESLLGFERIAAVRTYTQAVAGYVPDLAAYDETGVLTFVARDGKTYRAGGSVCFDNAYLDPYTSPLRREEVDFHLVVSNEAWYRDSCEMDQMVAFSRVAALATGRAVVRATNGGVTLVLGPDGRELARLVVGGRDRNVAGTLVASVPVPAERDPGPRTPFVRLERAWHGLLTLLPLALLLVPARRREEMPPPAR